MTTAKFVQIAASAAPSALGGIEHRLFALDDEGCLWYFNWEKKRWVALSMVRDA